MKIKTLKLARSVPFCGYSRDVWNADAQFSMKLEGEFFVLKSTTSSESLLLPPHQVLCAVIEQGIIQAPVAEKVIIHTPPPARQPEKPVTKVSVAPKAHNVKSK